MTAKKGLGDTVLGWFVVREDDVREPNGLGVAALRDERCCPRADRFHVAEERRELGR